MKIKKAHKAVTDYECADGLKFKVDEISLLLDIKFLMSEYYIATFSQNEKSLEIAFNNGQKFRLIVKEEK